MFWNVLLMIGCVIVLRLGVLGSMSVGFLLLYFSMMCFRLNLVEYLRNFCWGLLDW